MTWALKRQIFYVSVILIFLAILAYLVIAPQFKKLPTCIDQIQNGEETGIDCGGICPKACIFEVDQISVLWSRTFEVVPGRYNALAYLENHNKDSAIKKVHYRFRFADKNNIYIGKREGDTYIPPAKKFAIFESGIDLGNSVPVYTTFEFTETPVWMKVPENKMKELKVVVSNIQLQNLDTIPHLSADLKNNSLYVIPDMAVIAILYDKDGNAVTASRTYIEKMVENGSTSLNFTWPEPITKNIVLQEIIPMYDIFSVNLR